MENLELQRLLDGELDHEQRRLVLGQLDKQPSKWRMVALAMLEDQAFRRELGSISKTSNVLLDRSPMLDSETNFPSQKTSALGEINRWLPMSLAAGLLIGVGAFGGNWLASRFGSSDPMKGSNLSSSVASVAPVGSGQAASSASPLRPIGELKFASDVSSSANDDSIQVPMYEAAPGQLKQMLITQQKQIQQWNDQLRRRGYELDWQPEMLESRLPDGRSVIVPIQEVRVRSLGQ